MHRAAIWIKAFLWAVGLALIVHTFAFTSCTIPSTGMENSLYQGERVLVNKWSYGFRMPFSTKRFFSKRAVKGDIVLFNNPASASVSEAVWQRSLFISRCVGIPGDTLMLNEELMVSKERLWSPDSKSLYSYPCEYEDSLQQVMRQLHIEGNSLVGYSEGAYIRSFSHYEYYLLQQRLSATVPLKILHQGEEAGKAHPFVVPSKGIPVKVYPWNVALLCNTIVRHEGKQASVKGDTLFVAGKPVQEYSFQHDYYWMASNNPINLQDSRLFGFVPQSHLIGKAWYIWFTTRGERFFQRVQ